MIAPRKTSATETETPLWDEEVFSATETTGMMPFMPMTKADAEGLSQLDNIPPLQPLEDAPDAARGET